MIHRISFGTVSYLVIGLAVPANDGRLVTVAFPVQGSLWRFRPENEAR
jgi:hypothetical protein